MIDAASIAKKERAERSGCRVVVNGIKKVV